ncbi:hypothetical protein KIW84_021068 [Lathyrus oleraceus]|uniref:Uncharacterized protein n=1 Tax=Pisum sativum TaxID=3888 RepID=A0A9D5B8S4_PEA|nr:hypothetical protein KIW84_021068 [Pisum sativum]
MFNVVFHHEGEFLRLGDGDMIYRGGVSTIMFGQLIDKWSVVSIHKLHDVTDIEVIVKTHRCVNEIVKLDGCDDEGVEGFNDSEDERTIAIANEFDGIDVSLPITEGTIVAGFLTGSKKNKWEDDEYVSDELDNSDLYVSDDDNGPKFEKFRKKQLNNNVKFKWARDKPILTMCEWIRKYLLNRCSTSAIKLDRWLHKVMSIPRKRLDNEVAISGHWMPTWAMDEKFHATHSYNTHELIVDIAKREKYAICYGFGMSPINGQEMWPEVQSEKLQPPLYKKGPGKPIKLRIREYEFDKNLVRDIPRMYKRADGVANFHNIPREVLEFIRLCDVMLKEFKAHLKKAMEAPL